MPACVAHGTTELPRLRDSERPGLQVGRAAALRQLVHEPWDDHCIEIEPDDNVRQDQFGMGPEATGATGTLA